MMIMHRKSGLLGYLYIMSNYLLAARKRTLIPTGIILPFKDTSIPSGCERATEMDGKNIVGAGSTYAVASTGGDTALSFASSEYAAHWGSTTFYAVKYDSGGSKTCPSYQYAITSSTGGAGNHSHTITAEYERPYQQLIFIRTTEVLTQLPANTVVLSRNATSPISGLSGYYTDGKLLRSGASIAAGGALADEDLADSSYHIHASGIGSKHSSDASIVQNYFCLFRGIHGHTFSMSISDDELKSVCLTAWASATPTYAASGVIGFWEGATAPNGWHLHDGTDGYPNSKDRFLKLSATGDAGTEYDETNRVEATISIDDSAWSHDHKGSAETEGYGGTPVAVYHTSQSITHGHTAGGWHTLTPEYYGLTIIEMC